MLNVMHDLSVSRSWLGTLWSSSVSQPKWREHGHLYKWGAAAEGIQRPKSLHWQKTGDRTGCHDHFTAGGCCQQHLDEQDSQLRSSLVALQQRSGRRHTKGPMQRMMLTGSGRAACRGGGMCAVGWWGAAARCMVTPLPDWTLILDDSAENLRLH